jgi:hypothetical protein
MRNNTARQYNRIQTQFKTLTGQGMNPTDAKHHVVELWCKSPQSIGRIVKAKIEVPSVSNPNQTTLFDAQKKEVENV